MENFHKISIRGRYIYCYLCLRKVIVVRDLEDIPEFLDVILKSYTASSRLDDWQGEVDEVLPEVIFNEVNVRSHGVISSDQVLELRKYYSKNKLLTDILENLIWLGISNLYGGFNSNITFEYVKDVISLMNDNKIELPDFSIISSCSVNEQGGWGNRVDMDDFLKK